MAFAGWIKDISHWPAEVRRWLSEDVDAGADRSAIIRDVGRYWENLRDSVDLARAKGVSWSDLADKLGVRERVLRRVFE